MMRSLRKWWPVLAAAAALAAPGARAQQVAQERVAPLRLLLEFDAKRARWHLGPIRLLPVLRIGSLGYTNNALGQEGGEPDWTFTAGAGLKYVIPLGTRTYFYGEGVPTYTWYAHLVESRHFGGDATVNFATFLSRLSLKAGTEFHDLLRVYSSELSQPLRVEDKNANAALEVEIVSRLSLLASGNVQQTRNRSDVDTALDPQRLDSKYGAVRGGLKYRMGGATDVSALVEKTRQTFSIEGPTRDNQTTAYLLGIGHDFPRFYVSALGGYREGKAYNGSLYPDYGGFTGGGFVSWYARHRLEITLSGHRNLVPSLFAENPYYVEDAGRAGLNVTLGHRISLGGFGELSRLKYPEPTQVGESAIDREDKGYAFGGSLGILFGRATLFTTTFSRQHYDSNIPGYDRTIISVMSTLTLDAFLPERVRETR